MLRQEPALSLIWKNNGVPVCFANDPSDGCSWGQVQEKKKKSHTSTFKMSPSTVHTHCRYTRSVRVSCASLIRYLNSAQTTLQDSLMLTRETKMKVDICWPVLLFICLFISTLLIPPFYAAEFIFILYDYCLHTLHFVCKVSTPLPNYTLPCVLHFTVETSPCPCQFVCSTRLLGERYFMPLYRCV